MDHPESDGVARTRAKMRKLWQRGDLFHVFTRFPRKNPKLDRLAGILKHGLLAPAASEDGTIVTDLDIVYKGAPLPYDGIVFLHLFGENSWIYTACDPGRIVVFVDPSLPVITPESLGPNWCILCRDEVYVRDCIPLAKITAIAVPPGEEQPILEQLQEEFEAAAIPLYLWDGTNVWPGEV